MKSLSKLRKLALHKSDAKDKIDSVASTHVEELAQAAQDMQNMRNCYDSLLSAAAATANSAFEFSESLREMGSCLLEKTSLNDDVECGKILSALGNVQLELQKLVDNYRKNIFLTITNPSESLLNELRTVEDMKRQCDEKRNVYEYMVAQQREKGRSKGGKAENFSSRQLQTAHDQYDEAATLCVFRLKSLKQGQNRSLLTQAARHHAAQLKFFSKGLKSLEAVDTQVRLVAEQQHIDYQFCGHENDDGEDGEDDTDNNSDTNVDGELSFNYRQTKQGIDVFSTSRNSVEEDEVSPSFPKSSAVEVHSDKYTAEHQVPSKGTSYSAPIFAEKKIDLAEKIRQMQLSPRKSHTYVLPTPTDSKVPIASRHSVSHTGPANSNARNHNLSHSLPLEQKKQDDASDDRISEPSIKKAQSVLKESNSNSTSTGRLPPPLAEGFSLPQHNASDAKKLRRQSFSGPLASKSMSTKHVSSTGPIARAELPQLFSGLQSQPPAHQPSTSPKISPTASPPLVSSPRISELHELPRPPSSGLPTKPSKSSSHVGHSAPLVFKNPDGSSATSRVPSLASNTASPLPTPPLIVPRSFSIPSSSQRAMALHVSKLLESPKAEDVSSPPLTPISVSNIKPVVDSEVGWQFEQNQR